jgi:hypothetical protein
MASDVEIDTLEQIAVGLKEQSSRDDLSLLYSSTRFCESTMTLSLIPPRMR